MKKLELFLVVILLVGLVVLNKKVGKFVTSDDVEIFKETIVLDPGHGGNDPGKVGVNGVLEKDINLQIARKVKGLLEKEGITVVMTREKDEMLCDEATENKKQEDMKRRVELINQVKPLLAVSIHQNSYSDPEVSGAQVFYYSESEEGKRMADILQNALLEIDENNHRQVKANDNYYLLKKTEVPTVIVECGFLSNPGETDRLVTEEYQDRISSAIVQGIESCFAN